VDAGKSEQEADRLTLLRSAVFQWIKYQASGQLYQIHLDRNPQSTQQIGSKEERPFQDYNGEEIFVVTSGIDIFCYS
jgi:hypothetical protein